MTYPFNSGRELLNTAQFGGNTGRQGIFDPENPAEKHEALQRLKQLYTQYGDKLRYNYTGDTGLQPNDADGYYAMQNAITEADNISSILAGQQPKNMRFGGYMPNTRTQRRKDLQARDAAAGLYDPELQNRF